MITQITTVDALKQMFLEILLNKTDKISDIGNESVLNGIGYGCAKLANRLLVNQAVVEGHLFPDTAYGTYLDELASLRGIDGRYGAQGSSTYLLIEAIPGTQYSASGNVTFYSTSGIQFVPEETKTVDDNGFIYLKVRSLQTGANTNVDPLSINTINNKPTGHIAVTNEYMATGGRDEEDDDAFRQRIKESVNLLARNTLSHLEQVFMKINPRVLRILKSGTDENGTLNLIVVPTNGVDFTDSEFNALLSRSAEYLSIGDILNSSNRSKPLNLSNVNWHYVDIDFRAELDESYDYNTIRRNMQIKVNKLFDYRNWQSGDKVEWENILYAVKNIEGVRYIPDSSFTPRGDINIEDGEFPRVRSFVIRNLDGDVINDNYNVLSQFYYPNTQDVNYQSEVLSSI